MQYPNSTSFSYDVHIVNGKEQTKDAFTWVAPAGSFPFQQYATITDRKSTKGQTPGANGTMPPGVTPMKIISIQDLIKNAQKPNQKKKK